MKCSNCGNDGMVQSRAGWLCLHCGHLERDKSSPIAAQISTGKAGHAQARAAAAGHTIPVIGPSGPPKPKDGRSDSDEKSADEKPAAAAEPASDVPPPQPSAKPPWSSDADEAKPDDAKAGEEDKAKPDKPEGSSPAEDTPPKEKSSSPAPPWADTTGKAGSDENQDDTEPAEPESRDEDAEPSEPDKPDQESSADELKAVEDAVAEAKKVEEEPSAPEGKDSEVKKDDTADDAVANGNKEPEPKEVEPDQSKSTGDSGITSEDPEEPEKADEPSSTPAEPDAKPSDEQAEAGDAPKPEPNPADEPGRTESGAPAEPALAPSPTPAPNSSSETAEPPEPDKPHEDEKVTPEKLVAETAPGTSAPSTLPLNGKPPLQPVTHPRPLRAGLVAGVTLSLLVVVLAAAAGYLFFYQPQKALAAYLARLGTAKTATYTATTAGQGGGYRYALKLTAKSDLNNSAKPKLSLNATGVLNPVNAGSDQSDNFSGSLLVVDGKAYIKAKNAPAKLLPEAASDDWYNFAPATSDFSRCLSSGKSLSTVFSNAGSAIVPIKNASFAGFDIINGAKSLHFRGDLGAAKLQSYMDALAKGLPSGCKPNVKGMSVKYELWQGWSSDRFKLIITNADKTTTELLLDSSSYGQPVGVQAPAAAKDPGAASPSPSPSAPPSATPTPSPAASSDAGARDARRKTDLAAYVAAFRSTASGGYYKTNPPAVSVNAKDPSTGAAYQVSRNKAIALGQIEYRAGGRCTAPDITPGTASTRYIALHMKLEGQADYCLDVK